MKLSASVRVRLATVADSDFLAMTNEMADSGGRTGRVHEVLYQRAVRETIDNPGGYFQSLQSHFNEAIAQGRPETSIHDAMLAGSFDLVFEVDGRPGASQSIGFSQAVLHGFLEQDLDPRQVLSFMMGLPKLRAFAVLPDFRGRGVGAVALNLLRDLISRMGVIGIHGECREELADYYVRHGVHVMGPGQHLNLAPLAGAHITGGTMDVNEGPFIAAEKGYQVFYLTAGNGRINETECAFTKINDPVPR